MPKTKIVKSFFADIPAGTSGKVIRTWTVNGKNWYRLLFGYTKDGSKIEQSFPEDVLK